MSRKENALDLAKFIDKGVRVKLSGGREGAKMLITGSKLHFSSILLVDLTVSCILRCGAI